MLPIMLRAASVAALLAGRASAAAAAAAAPCAVVSTQWAAQIAANPKATPTVDASIAYECLKSVPLGKQAALDLVDALVPYLEWQSDAAYKANPPKDYFYPPFDMFAELARVKAGLQADKYAGEYDFQVDLYVSVSGNAHDGHFIYSPDALTKVFEWGRQRSLVSISEDGTSLPVVKLYEDVIANPDKASVVTLINGQTAVTYLEDTIFKASFNQDADAAWNSLFYAKAMVASTASQGYFSGGGRIRYLYQGPNTTFTFQNGTTVTFGNTANVKANMTGVVDGKTFYQTFCDPAAGPPDSDGGSETANLALAGYPSPIMTNSDGILSGYYLDAPGYEDVAVIAVLSFHPASMAEFQRGIQQFLAKAKADGKEKLVVDFQANGGGQVFSGFDLFRQLFPNIVQDGFSRWKESDGFLAMSQIASERVAGLDPYTSNDAGSIRDWLTWFNWRNDLNLTNQHFTSFEDKFAPHVYQKTNYTNIMRSDVGNVLYANKTFGFGMSVTGYGPLANVPQYFAAEDIILLYDGFCASTCVVASEALRIQGGVRSVAMGGRPQDGHIQGVGGVKGMQVLHYPLIHTFATRWAPSATTDAQKAALARISDLPINRSTANALNVRDMILRDNVADGLPAQYVVETSDCRLYWTLPMIRNITAVWEAVAGAAFKGNKCAAGSIPPAKGGTKRAAQGAHAVPDRRGSVANDGRAAAIHNLRRREGIDSKASADFDAIMRAAHVQKVVP